MAQNGPKRPKMVPKWPKIAQNGQKSSKRPKEPKTATCLYSEDFFLGTKIGAKQLKGLGRNGPFGPPWIPKRPQGGPI